MSWSFSDYPFEPGGTSVPVTSGQQSGLVLAVPADGSATVAVTFPSRYSVAVTWVGVQPTGSTPNGLILVAEPVGVGLTGFSISVTGGPAGSTTNVYWQSQGS